MLRQQLAALLGLFLDRDRVFLDVLLLIYGKEIGLGREANLRKIWSLGIIPFRFHASDTAGMEASSYHSVGPASLPAKAWIKGRGKVCSWLISSYVSAYRVSVMSQEQT